MKTFDIIQMCLRNLIRRKYRTLLTLVGVVAGTCAVVLMIAVGLGMKASQEEQLAQMGDLSIIAVYSYGKTDELGNKVIMDDATVESIRAMSGVMTATPLYRPRNLSAQFFAGKNERYMTYFYNVIGVYPDSLPLLGYELIEGTWADAFASPYSIVMGQYGAYNLEDTRKTRGNNRVDPYPDRFGNISEPFVNMLDSRLLIRLQQESENAKNIEYKPTVTAVMKEDWQRGYETSRGMFMSIDDLKKMEADYIKANKIKVDKSNDNGYEETKVKVTDINYVDAVQTAIEDMGFDTWSMESIRKPMVEQTKKIQIFLGMIAGVSLFVASLGIINTMLMSVYERTREIGVMKVVGCHVKNIRTLFLMEAGCIGLLGGIVGIILSSTIAYLVNYMGLSISFGSDIFGSGEGAAQMFIITPWLVLLALVFSTLIGILSGYYPANRAVKISALTAIKQE
ncbi:MAG: ABC transporter permease [Candidatus Fimivivens sp.]